MWVEDEATSPAPPAREVSEEEISVEDIAI
jgi:hypothetical protein